jgi:hypothetical protein
MISAASSQGILSAMAFKMRFAGLTCQREKNIFDWSFAVQT